MVLDHGFTSWPGLEKDPLVRVSFSGPILSVHVHPHWASIGVAAGSKYTVRLTPAPTASALQRPTSAHPMVRWLSRENVSPANRGVLESRVGLAAGLCATLGYIANKLSVR